MTRGKAISILGLKENRITAPKIYHAFCRKGGSNNKQVHSAKNFLLRERVLKTKQSGKKFKPKEPKDYGCICLICKGTGETNYKFKFKVISCGVCEGTGWNKRTEKRCWKCKGKKEINFPIKIISAVKCKECGGTGSSNYDIENPVLNECVAKKIK